jgi:hypothetical protein
VGVYVCGLNCASLPEKFGILKNYLVPCIGRDQWDGNCIFPREL